MVIETDAHLAIIWRIDYTEQRPEWCTGFSANEDRGTHAADLNNFRTNAGNETAGRCLRRFLRFLLLLLFESGCIQLTKHIAIALRRLGDESVGAMDF